MTYRSHVTIDPSELKISYKLLRNSLCTRSTYNYAPESIVEEANSLLGKASDESGAGGLRLKRNTISKGGDNLCGPMSCDIRNIKGRKGRANGGAVQRRKKDQGKGGWRSGEAEARERGCAHGGSRRNVTQLSDVIGSSLVQ